MEYLVSKLKLCHASVGIVFLFFWGCVKLDMPQDAFVSGPEPMKPKQPGQRQAKSEHLMLEVKNCMKFCVTLSLPLSLFLCVPGVHLSPLLSLSLCIYIYTYT